MQQFIHSSRIVTFCEQKGMKLIFLLIHEIACTLSMFRNFTHHVLSLLMRFVCNKFNITQFFNTYVQYFDLIF